MNSEYQVTRRSPSGNTRRIKGGKIPTYKNRHAVSYACFVFFGRKMIRYADSIHLNSISLFYSTWHVTRCKLEEFVSQTWRFAFGPKESTPRAVIANEVIVLNIYYFIWIVINIYIYTSKLYIFVICIQYSIQSDYHNWTKA